MCNYPGHSPRQGSAAANQTQVAPAAEGHTDWTSEAPGAAAEAPLWETVTHMMSHRHPQGCHADALLSTSFFWRRRRCPQIHQHAARGLTLNVPLSCFMHCVLTSTEGARTCKEHTLRGVQPRAHTNRPPTHRPPWADRPLSQGKPSHIKCPAPCGTDGGPPQPSPEPSRGRHLWLPSVLRVAALPSGLAEPEVAHDKLRTHS